MPRSQTPRGLIAKGQVQSASQHGHQGKGVFGDRIAVQPGEIGDDDFPLLRERTQFLRHTGGDKLNPAQLRCVSQALQRRQTVEDVRRGQGSIENRGLAGVDPLELRSPPRQLLEHALGHPGGHDNSRFAHRLLPRLDK